MRNLKAAIPRSVILMPVLDLPQDSPLAVVHSAEYFGHCK